MPTIAQTTEFATWMRGLKDLQAAARINLRIQRLELGNPGDAKSVGGGVSELRIDYGPGYRVYFCRRDEDIILLLCGGDKRTQDKDIKRAHKLGKEAPP